MSASPNLYGYQMREPFAGEQAYFSKNPQVAGMAAEDGKIILNPFSKLSATQKAKVAQNEAIRLFLRDNPVDLNFDLTNEQQQFFKDTPYASDSSSAKQTVVARILTGDTSVGRITPEQKAAAARVSNLLPRIK